MYYVDISPTNGLFNASTDVIIHSKYGNLNINSSQIGTFAIIEAGTDAYNVKITIRIEAILTSLYNKKYPL